jgi:hypothetical protein
MESNRREFLDIVQGQELRAPSSVEQAITDPEVIAAFDRAFPEVGVYHEPYQAFCEILDLKCGIGFKNKAEKMLVIELLLQKRIGKAIEGLINGKA